MNEPTATETLAQVAPASVGRRVLLVRHAAAAGVAGRCCGQLDVPLSEQGRAQARALADALAGLPVSSIVSSPLARARQTAEQVAERLALPLTFEANLSEMHFGAWEGQAYDHLQQASAELYQTWLADPTGFQFPEGESWQELQRRVWQAWCDLVARHPTGLVLVVTHAGVIRTLLATLLDLPRTRLFSLACDPTHLTCLEALGDAWLLRAFNWPPLACQALLTRA